MKSIPTPEKRSSEKYSTAGYGADSRKPIEARIVSAIVSSTASLKKIAKLSTTNIPARIGPALRAGDAETIARRTAVTPTKRKDRNPTNSSCPLRNAGASASRISPAVVSQSSGARRNQSVAETVTAAAPLRPRRPELTLAGGDPQSPPAAGP